MGVEAGQAEFDFRIRGLRPNAVHVRIQPPEVVVEDVKLALDLLGRDVLGGGAVHHVENHGDGDHGVLIGRPLLCHDRRPLRSVLLNALGFSGVFLQSHHLDVLLVRKTAAFSRDNSLCVGRCKTGVLSDKSEWTQTNTEQRECKRDTVHTVGIFSQITPNHVITCAWLKFSIHIFCNWM